MHGLVVAVQVAVEAEQQRIGKGPGLALVETKVLHLQAGLLENLTVHAFLDRLADLCKARNAGHALAGPVGVSRHQDLVIVRNRNDDSRIQSRIINLPAFRADIGPLPGAGFQLCTAGAAVYLRFSPADKLQSRNRRKRQILRILIPEFGKLCVAEALHFHLLITDKEGRFVNQKGKV